MTSRARAGAGRGTTVVALACSLVLLHEAAESRLASAQTPLVFGPAADARVAARVDRVFWLRPGLADTSVDVFDDAALRIRRGLRGTHRVRIERIDTGGPWPGRDPVYALRLDDGRVAWMGVAEFEKRLFVEPGPNAVPQSPLFTPPLGQGIQVWMFDRASVFDTDPAVLEVRLRPQGPRSFRPGPAPPPLPPSVVPNDPTAPVISPR